MDDTVRFIRENDCTVSWLYGRPEVYRSSGFVSFEGYSTVSAEIDISRIDSARPDVTVRPVDRTRDVPVLMGMYQAWNDGLSGPIVRSAEVWKERVLGPNAREGWDKFHIVESGGYCLGYYQLVDDNRVGEIGAFDDEGALEVIRALALRTGGELALDFCFDRLERLLRAFPGTVSRKNGLRHGMWRLFDGTEIGLAPDAGTEDLVALLDTLELVYYRMDRF